MLVQGAKCFRVKRVLIAAAGDAPTKINHCGEIIWPQSIQGRGHDDSAAKISAARVGELRAEILLGKQYYLEELLIIRLEVDELPECLNQRQAKRLSLV